MTVLGEPSAGPLVRVTHEEQLLAAIMRNEFRERGITFFTEDELSQQTGFMRDPTGKVIEHHLHNHISRSVNYTEHLPTSPLQFS